MSGTDNMDALVHARFHEAFGEPQNEIGKGEHWALKPASDAIDIHVMVNGTTTGPSVWVFDPNDQDDGIVNTSIGHEDEIEVIINRIRERVARADLRRALDPSG